MFGIGTSELLIILFIALLILGPKEIPKIAKTLGKGMRELQRAKDGLRESLESEINYDDEEVAKAKQQKKAEEKAAEESKSSDKKEEAA